MFPAIKAKSLPSAFLKGTVHNREIFVSCDFVSNGNSLLQGQTVKIDLAYSMVEVTSDTNP
jgi:hypothetical protein